MDTISNTIGEILNSGDPTVRSWFLVRQNYLPLILCTCYAAFSCIIGPALMKNRKPFELRILMIVFNFFLVYTYTICFILVVWYLPEVTRDQFCKGSVVKEGDVTYTLATLAWIIYLTKYVEFLDTVIFVFRKKQNQITFLHVMHHTVVPLLAWTILRSEKSGMLSIPGIINSVIHIIMYTYYGLAAMGPEVRKLLWWKKYLTQLQMVQFTIIIIFVAIVAPLSGCSMVISSYAMCITFAPLFLYLFYKYYKSSFDSSQRLTEINANTKNGSMKND